MQAPSEVSIYEHTVGVDWPKSFLGWSLVRYIEWSSSLLLYPTTIFSHLPTLIQNYLSYVLIIVASGLKRPI